MNKYEIFKSFCLKNNIEPFDLGQNGAQQVRKVYENCFKGTIGYWSARDFRDALAKQGYQELIDSPLYDSSKTSLLVEDIKKGGIDFRNPFYNAKRIKTIYYKIFNEWIENSTANKYFYDIQKHLPHLCESIYERDEKIRKICSLLEQNNLIIALNKNGYLRIQQIYSKLFNEEISYTYAKNFTRLFQKKGYTHLIKNPYAEIGKTHTIAKILEEQKTQVTNDSEGWEQIQSFYQQAFNNIIPIETAKGYMKYLKVHYEHLTKKTFTKIEKTHTLAKILKEQNIRLTSDKDGLMLIQNIYQKIFNERISEDTAKKHNKLLKKYYSSLIIQHLSRKEMIIKLKHKLKSKNILLTLGRSNNKVIQQIYKELTGIEITQETAYSYINELCKLEYWDLFQQTPLLLETKLDVLTSKLFIQLQNYFKTSYEKENDFQHSLKMQTAWKEYFGQDLSEKKAIKYLKELYHIHHHKPLSQTSNNIFLQLLEYIDVKKEILTENSLKRYWKLVFGRRLSKETPRQKLKFFTQDNDYMFSVKFTEKLPLINTTLSHILIKEVDNGKLMNHWNSFKYFIQNNRSLFYDFKEKDFILPKNISYENLLKELSYLDESIKSDYRKKRLIVLFFMYITGQGIALLPTTFIFSGDSFIFSSSKLIYLKLFQEKHFFTTQPYHREYIREELKTNSKAKVIFYYRFSYLVQNDIDQLNNVSDSDIRLIMDNMTKTKTKKMVLDNENPIRRCMFWHGAQSISQTKAKAKAKTITLSPLELLSKLGPYERIKGLLDAFFRFFNNRPNNAENRRYSKEAVALLEYLYDTHDKVNKEYLYKFFYTNIVKNENGESELSSRFLQYLNQRALSASAKQAFQSITFQSIESDYELAGAFPESFLVVLYSMPRNRNIARLALDKRVIEEMKNICIFNPPKDNYYVSSSINKDGISWQHFDKVEPQLPVMLFLHLCMPWRSEHIKSLDRDNFLHTDALGNIVGVQVTTDKNQNNDFYIEREFFDYAFSLNDLQGEPFDVIYLLQETIAYAKQSFPLLQAELRKENENWGPIKPILCSRKAKGFMSDEIYSGYYYKVLLKALHNLGYKPDEIEYFVQLSPSGIDKLGKITSNFDIIDDLTCGNTNKYFNSEYFSPHALRKSNITYFVQDKRSFEFILKLSGHKVLNTVLQVYIDYKLLATMGLSEETITAIEENFRTENTKIYARAIIENFKKYHLVNSDIILQHIEKDNLFFSLYLLDKKSNSLTKNDTVYTEILSPIFWEEVLTGICTCAYNCPSHIRMRCSLCPYFLTGPKFFSATNARIMQLTTKVSEYYKIIDKHTMLEHLSGNEAILYEEEAQLDLAELQGYMAITQNLNDSLHNMIIKNATDEQKKHLPAPQEFDAIFVKHIPSLAAQYEIYKAAKQNYDISPSVEYAISTLYNKIMELIILGEIPRELFTDSILVNDQEKAIDTFMTIVENYGNLDKLDNILDQFLPNSML